MSPTQNIESVLAAQLCELETKIRELVSDGSPTAVHAVRVASRRAEAAIYLCQDSLSKSDYRFYVRRCGQVRTRTNKLRDCDVLLKQASSPSGSSKHEKKLRRWQQESRDALDRCVQRWLKHDSLVTHRQSIEHQAKPALVQGLAMRITQLAARLIVKATDLPICDRNVHRLRIAVKRLRYGFEFLKHSGCPIDLEARCEKLEQLQSKLGKWTDALQSRQLLKKSDPEEFNLSLDESVEISLVELEQIFEDAIQAAQWCQTLSQGARLTKF
jgi:CHAD domain-containing protein